MSEAVIAQKAPYGKEIEAGKTYYWCACGRSANAVLRWLAQGRRHGAAGLHRREDGDRLALRLQTVQERALLRRLAQEPVSVRVSVSADGTIARLLNQ